MTNIITISANYDLNATGVVDLSPKTWDDVEDWYIKWDVLHVRFEGDDGWHSFDINSDTTDGADWKRPASVSIYAGEEFEEEIATRVGD